MELPDHAIELILDRAPVARLATTSPDGSPHQVPFVFARAAGRLWSPIDEKPKAAGILARERNLQRDPRASVLLDQYADDWTRLWWLHIRGTAQLHHPAAADNDQTIAAVVAALRAKYPQYARVGVLRDPPTLISVASERVSSWCAGPAAVDALLAHFSQPDSRTRAGSKR